jgi:hypothetical protein
MDVPRPHYDYTAGEEGAPQALTCGVCHDVALTHRGCPQCKATFCKASGDGSGGRWAGRRGPAGSRARAARAAGAAFCCRAAARVPDCVLPWGGNAAMCCLQRMHALGALATPPAPSGGGN